MLQAPAMLMVSMQRKRVGLVKLVPALALTFLTLSTPPASGQPAAGRDQLFLDQSPAQTEALRKKFPPCRTETYSFASRASCFRIDPKALERTIANDDPGAGLQVRLLPAEVGRPDIFASKSFSRALDRRGKTGGIEWLGSVHSDRAPAMKIGTALFSVREGTVVGRITTEKEVFEIRPLQKGLHVIIRADLWKLPPKHPVAALIGRPSSIAPGPPPPEQAACTSATSTDEPETPEVKVSVVFEEGAMPAMTDLASIAQGYVSFTDLAMLNSQAVARISPAGGSFVHTIPKFVNDFRTLRVVVAGSSTSPGSIGDLHKWRASDSADVVVIVTNALGSCGYATRAKPDDAKYGFVMVSPDCANVELQVGHEIGHVLGGDHEVGVNISPNTEAYARAYIMAGLGKRTIMVETNGQVEPHYSNPRVCWDATQPPQATGTVGTENAKAISERAGIVSNFMP